MVDRPPNQFLTVHLVNKLGKQVVIISKFTIASQTMKDLIIRDLVSI